MRSFLAISLLSVGPLAACSPPDAPAPPALVKRQVESEKVYTYVEQMPELPGGGGTGAIVNEFFKNFHPSAAAIRGERNRPIVHFEVGPDGKVCQVKMHTSSNSANFDSAMIAAVHAFPRFTPGRQNGKAVTVSFDLPISCYKPQ